MHYGLSTFWRFFGTLIVGTIALALVIALIPGIEADDLIDVFVAVVLVSVTAAVLIPILAALAGALSWFGVFVIGLLSQGLVIYIGLILSPGIHVDGFWPAFWAAWAYAFVAAVLSWFFLVDDDQALLSHVMRQATRGRKGRPIDDPDTEGVVIVQVDGLPWPVLRFMVSAGNLPTISRWVRSGSHTMREWTARTPCTTPISQAGILHGNTEAMPAFRWYEKDAGRLIVSNKPADAALIESRVSNGRGLLADDGASISNLFSGDATVSLLSMSGMAQGKSGLGPSKNYASFFMHPYGFPRALILTIGEIMKEHHQARVQRRTNVLPRIERKRPYPLLRGVTNVLLRDLNLALVAEQMVHGRKVIYVDFVDYDEIAHHAGPVRPESLKSLTGLDQVLHQLEQVAEQVERRYHLVVVSDHGQSQGATFRQRYGRGLEDVVHDLMGGGDLAAVTSSVEDWGPVNTFLSQVGQQDSVSGGVLRRVLRKKTDDGDVELGPSSDETAAVEAAPKELVVVGSGNLGLVWFAREPGRLTLEDLEGEVRRARRRARQPPRRRLGARADRLGRPDGHRPRRAAPAGLGRGRGSRPAAPVRRYRPDRPAAGGALPQRTGPLRRQPVRPRDHGRRRLRGARRVSRRPRRLADGCGARTPHRLDGRQRDHPRRRAGLRPAGALAGGPGAPQERRGHRVGLTSLLRYAAQPAGT